MTTKIFLFIYINIFATICYGFEFPNDIQQCNVGDTSCITQVSNEFLRTKGKTGHRGINLKPVDPLRVSKFALIQNQINLTFKDVDIIGLSNSHFEQITGFQQNPNGKYSLTIKGPLIEFVGNYQGSGRVLLLPLTGSGQAKISFVDPTIILKFDGKSVDRNGNEHLSIDNAKISFTVSRVRFRFENLFNGDRTLGEQMNTFLNENWKEILDLIRDSISKGLSSIAKSTLKKVFNQVPYKDLFKH